MLSSAKAIIGYEAHGRDGHIGEVADLYFDDLQWHIRYLVLQTADWMERQYLLMAPEAIERVSLETERIILKLDRKELSESPSMDQEKPVSRQHQVELHEYFNWPFYWRTPSATGLSAAGAVPPIPPQAVPQASEDETDDPHLRSVQEVLNYEVQGNDGSIGHLADFIVNDQNWAIFYMVVDIGRWLLPDKHVLLAASWVQEIDWPAGELRVDLGKEIIRKSPEFDRDQMIDREYEKQLFEYFERPGYW